jgi:phytoene synthase
MSVTGNWEIKLLSYANEAENSYNCDDFLNIQDSITLNDAYKYCDDLTQVHSRTFYMASSLLPPEKRRGVRALYAFCRVSDDLVDRPRDNSAGLLKDWRSKTINSKPTGDDLVAIAWDHASRHFCIPWRYAEQLIDGVAMDLQKNRYESFNELTYYCYGVACTVGLMSMHIVGFQNEEAIPYAIRLGVALQLTNILRDVGEDWKLGRLYLPQDELNSFGISESVIAQGTVTSTWREFMDFQISRVRSIYQSALPGIALLDPDGRFAIGAAAELYQAILTRIEENDYDVFNQRASVGKIGKLRRLPGIWWRTRNGYRDETIPINTLI